MKSKLTAIVAIAVMFGCMSHAKAQKNLGMVGIKSVHGRYLQAHDSDGEMHASNPKRNQEETWFLIEVDKQRHIYALENWRNGKFMSKKGNRCAPADSTTLSLTEQWELVSGKQHGVLNAVAFRSVSDHTFLSANKPGDDTPCGGEVWAPAAGTPPDNNGSWPCWWVVETASEPSPGKDFWNTVGNAVQGIANNINPADVASLLALIAG